jgi:hypothetical protein
MTNPIVAVQVSGSPVDLLPEIPVNAGVAAFAAFVIAVAAVVYLAKRVHAARTLAAEQPTAGRGADALTRAAALIATIVAGQGMWQFLDRIIGEVHWSLRGLMFAFLEIAVITSAVRARRSMRENYSAGIDGIAVWVLTSVSAVLAAMEAASLPEALFRLAAPLVAAWLWERGMAIERRRLRGGQRINWRFTPERVMVWLGLAEAKNRTADQVDTERRLAQVALAAKRARELREAGASARKQRAALRSLDRAFAAAEEHVGLASDESKQQVVKAKVAALYSAGHLVDVEAASAWTTPAPEPTPDPQASEFARLAEETRDLNDALTARRETRELLATLTSMAAYVTDSHVMPATSNVTPLVTRRDVTGGLTGGVADPVTDPSPSAPGWPSGAAPVATPGVTPAVIATGITDGVASDVAFDVTDPDVFAPRWPPLDLVPATPAVTLDATAEHVAEDVADDVTDDDPETQSKTAKMRTHWDTAVAEKRYPSVAELADVAGAHHSLASRKRIAWVAELPWQQRRKANPRREKTSA